MLDTVRCLWQQGLQDSILFVTSAALLCCWCRAHPLTVCRTLFNDAHHFANHLLGIWSVYCMDVAWGKVSWPNLSLNSEIWPHGCPAAAVCSQAGIRYVCALTASTNRLLVPESC